MSIDNPQVPPTKAKTDKPLDFTASDLTIKPVQRINSIPTMPAPRIRPLRPRRNFNPKKTARYGRPTFTPDILVKYSPKYQYSRLFEFPFSGSHFRPCMQRLVLSIDGGCLINDRAKSSSHAACAVYFGLGNKWNYAGPLKQGEVQTSNRAELQAAIVAMEIVEQRISSGEADMVKEVIMQTDSEYVSKSMNVWVWGWEKNGWKTRQGGAVANMDKMRHLHETVSVFEREYRIAVRFWRVGREWNEEADGMVREVLGRGGWK